VSFQVKQNGSGLGQSADGGLIVNGVRVQETAAMRGSLITQSFFWMFAGLLLTAAVAGAVQLNETLLEFAANNFLILFLVQLGIVIAISAGINRLSAIASLGLFFVYAASLGITIGLIVRAYTGESVVAAFVSSAAMFGAAGLYGYTTKRSLASIGAFAFMALIGLIVAMVVNIFLASSTLGFIISIVGVVIFTALTAWHVQKISTGQLVAMTGSVEKAAVLGALTLYLDFINLFLLMLRLTGARR